MFVLTTNSGSFYNGKAGSAWLSSNKADAFTYSKEGAERKAAQFNKFSSLHGQTFKVDEI